MVTFDLKPMTLEWFISLVFIITFCTRSQGIISMHFQPTMTLTMTLTFDSGSPSASEKEENGDKTGSNFLIILPILNLNIPLERAEKMQ